MNKRTVARLVLNRETLRQLSSGEMAKVAGGGTEETLCWSFCFSCLCEPTFTCKLC